MDPKKALMLRWFEEVWNKRRESAIDEMLAPDAIVHGLSDDPAVPLRGPAGFKPFYHKFRDAFPDVKITVDQTVIEGDKIVLLCHVRGTHGGGTLGIAARNKPVSFSGTVIGVIKNGMIVEGWNHFDFLGMFQQLGAVTLN